MTALAAVLVSMAVLVRFGSGPRARLAVTAPGSAAVVAACLTGSGAAFVCLAAGTSAATVVTGCVAFLAVTATLRRRRRQRRHAERSREVVALTRALAAEVRAGSPPGAALAAAAAAAPSVAAHVHAAARAAELGGDVAAEMRRVADLDGCRRLTAVASAWQVMATTGARTADVLDDVSAALEADDELRDELDAMLAGPRATVVVLALLPVVAVTFASAAGASSLEVLLRTPLGHGLLGAAFVLDLAGVAWIRAVTGGAVAAAA